MYKIAYEDDTFSFAGKPEELVALIREKANLVPSEFKDSTTIEIETYGEYDMDFIRLVVEYYDQTED